MVRSRAGGISAGQTMCALPCEFLYLFAVQDAPKDGREVDATLFGA
jgi:hypothetical protein